MGALVRMRACARAFACVCAYTANRCVEAGTFARVRVHARTHARMHARIHARTYARCDSFILDLSKMTGPIPTEIGMLNDLTAL